MRKITPEQFLNQVQHGFESDLATAKYIAEQERRVDSYRQTIEDMQKILDMLNKAPYKGMLNSLIQAVVDVLIQNEAG